MAHKFQEDSSDSNCTNAVSVKIDINYIKDYFKIVKENGTMTNKDFWNPLRYFLTNEEMMSTDEITWKVADKLLNDELKVTEIFYDAFMNIVEKTSRKKSTGVLYYQNKIFRVVDKTLE